MDYRLNGPFDTAGIEIGTEIIVDKWFVCFTRRENGFVE